jgi:O-antigen/teichoic acid export membrane protein
MSKPLKLISLLKNPAARSIGIYTFTNFLGKAASFLLIFIFTNPLYISPSENGLLSLFSTGMLFLMPFLSMGIIHSTSTDFFKMPKDEFKNFFTTGFVMSFIVMILACFVMFFLQHQLKDIYGYPAMFCWLIPVITFLTFCNEQFLALVRNNNQPGIYFKANTFKIILELGISFVLVVFFAWRWQGRIAGIFIAYLLTGFYGFRYLYRNGYLFGKVIKKIIQSELLYAFPIITMQVSIFCMGASDKFFLSGFTNDNNETVGIYSIASVFASIIIVLSTALIQYVFPKIYEQLSEGPGDYKIIKKLFWLYLTVMFAGTITIALFTPLAYKYFINEKYNPALSYIFILFAGYFIWTIVYFFYSFLLYFKEKRKIMLLSVYSIACALGLNYFFIPRWGAWGAAISTLVTYVAVLGMALFFTKDYWRNFIKNDHPL